MAVRVLLALTFSGCGARALVPDTTCDPPTLAEWYAQTSDAGCNNYFLWGEDVGFCRSTPRAFFLREAWLGQAWARVWFEGNDGLVVAITDDGGPSCVAPVVLEQDAHDPNPQIVWNGTHVFVFWNSWSQGAFVRARISRNGELLDVIPLDVPADAEAAAAVLDGAVAVGYTTTVQSGDPATRQTTGHLKVLDADARDTRWEKQFPGSVESIVALVNSVVAAWSELDVVTLYPRRFSLEFFDADGNETGAPVDLWDSTMPDVDRPDHVRLAASPDGAWVAWDTQDSVNPRVWLARYASDGTPVLPKTFIARGRDALIAATAGVAALAWSGAGDMAPSSLCSRAVDNGLFDPTGATIGHMQIPDPGLQYEQVVVGPAGFSIATTAEKTGASPPPFGDPVIFCSTPVALGIDLAGHVVDTWLPWSSAWDARDGGIDR
jgi:hypothetical protein